jgi:hypothetical protein
MVRWRLLAGFPSQEERLDILHAVSKDMELSDEALAYLPEIASAPKSAHFSGADLQAVRPLPWPGLCVRSRSVLTTAACLWVCRSCTRRSWSSCTRS